jgi:hypothetical protein
MRISAGAMAFALVASPAPFVDVADVAAADRLEIQPVPEPDAAVVFLLGLAVVARSAAKQRARGRRPVRVVPGPFSGASRPTAPPG